MRILVATGASGGHIFPALACIDLLAKQQHMYDTLLVLPKKIRIAPETLRGYKHICVASISCGWPLGLRSVVAATAFLKTIAQSFFILVEFRPHIVVGFGSLATVPLILWAWFFRIHTIIHEQNVIPGRANALLSLVADTMAVSFSQTREYLKSASRKTIVTGNVLRFAMRRVARKEAAQFFGLSPQKFTILVMGGSQGSHRLNTISLDAIAQLADRAALQIIHLTGIQDYDYIQRRYRELGVEARVFTFFKEMQHAYSASDLAISRAGATTIAELICFQLPALLVPYPFAYKHQEANAKTLASERSVLVVNEENLNPATLRTILEELLRDRERLSRMRQAYVNTALGQAETTLCDAILAFTQVHP